MQRSAEFSCIRLHCPGPYGIGDLGPEAYRFADWLAAAGQRIWQVLPLGPTGYGESPYQLFSAFAGNPLLLSLDRPVDIREVPPFPQDHVDFESVIPWKTSLLRLAFETFRPNAEFDAFCQPTPPGSTISPASWR